MVRAILLAGPRDALELAPLHLLYEHTKSRLLAQVEHLVDPLVGALDLGRGSAVEILQPLQAISQLGVVGFAIRGRQAEQVPDDASALVLGATANFLQPFVRARNCRC